MNLQCLILIAVMATVQSYQDYENRGNLGKTSFKVDRINLNEWFDRSLPFIRKYVVRHDLEPMNFPDIILSIITHPSSKSKLYIQNCLVFGTTNVTRSGDIVLYKDQHLWQLDMQLNWHDIKVTCDYTLKYRMLQHKGNLEGRFRTLNVAMLSAVDLNERKVYVRFLKIIDAGNFSIELHGHLIDPIINTAIKAATFSFKKRVLREIEYRMYTAVQLKINELNEWLTNHTNIDIQNLPLN